MRSGSPERELQPGAANQPKRSFMTASPSRRTLSCRSTSAASTRPSSNSRNTSSDEATRSSITSAGSCSHYLDILRTNDLVLIQLTVSNTRPLVKKQALYRRIVDRLTASPGLRPEDIFINLVEVLPENWSFGHGLAQYVKQDSA